MKVVNLLALAQVAAAVANAHVSYQPSERHELAGDGFDEVDEVDNVDNMMSGFTIQARSPEPEPEPKNRAHAIPFVPANGELPTKPVGKFFTLPAEAAPTLSKRNTPQNALDLGTEHPALFIQKREPAPKNRAHSTPHMTDNMNLPTKSVGKFFDLPIGGPAPTRVKRDAVAPHNVVDLMEQTAALMPGKCEPGPETAAEPKNRAHAHSFMPPNVELPTAPVGNCFISPPPYNFKRAVVTTQSFLDLAEETPAPNLDPFQSTFGGAVSAMADARVITPTSPADIDLPKRNLNTKPVPSMPHNENWRGYESKYVPGQNRRFKRASAPSPEPIPKRRHRAEPPIESFKPTNSMKSRAARPSTTRSKVNSLGIDWTTLTQTTTVTMTQATTVPVTRFKSVVRPVLATSTATLTVEEETTKTKTVRATATVTTTTTLTETQMETRRARTVEMETQFMTVTEPTTTWVTVTVPTTVGAEASPTTRIQVGKDLENMDGENLNAVLKGLEDLEMKDPPNIHGDTEMEWADHEVVVDGLVDDIDEDAESVL
ncbi:Protein of unknown function [Pyronema omphalodes CBS 100304]|uniref:Uncharacterized protein n=1 Tax=Pyronema omphalodes (strain CBS 100304) TaxID=1076935 RepID=U4LFI3_PYROM|nr:Protein of unknown function [Pyronema omphalodes CBS 100304]